MSMRAMMEAAPWKANGWKEAQRGRSGTHPLQWLRGIRTLDRFDCPMREFRLSVIDHLACFIDENGNKVVVSHPYCDEIPDGLAAACKELHLEFEWLPPSESWYGYGTPRVMFRLDRRVVAMRKLGGQVAMGTAGRRRLGGR